MEQGVRVQVSGKPHVIVLGNEKGGSGKSTTAVHLAVSLCAMGARVGGIDLDDRQRTFARYMENRGAHARRKGIELPTPETMVMGDAEGPAGLGQVLRMWAGTMDAIVIDTPGRHGPLLEAALSRADTLVTPINDSFLDLDLLGQVDPETWKVKRPSFYAEFVWETRKKRAQADKGEVDWVVLRNRIASLEAKNMRRILSALKELSKRVGFRSLPGLSERVIYRELFPQGLTLVDVAALPEVTLSHVAARAELRGLVGALGLPFVNKAAA